MRVRTAGKEVKPVVSEVQIPQRLSITLLDTICSYMVTDNKNIRRKGYTNILMAMNTLDLSIYTDDAYLRRFDFIKTALIARVENGLNDQALVMDFIENNLGDLYKDINLRELNNKEIDYINNTVSNMLDNVVFARNIMSFETVAQRFKEASPNQKPAIIEEWKGLVNDSKNAIRRHRIEKTDEQMYCLQEGVFEDYVMYTHADLSSPGNKLATGMIGFNILLAGGFQSDRTYCIFGLQGEGKSSTLVNLAYQIKMYNRSYRCKDPTKTPCVVYLTMEDHPKETLSRQFSMVTEQGSLIDHDVNESIQLMRQGGLAVTPDNPIDIVVKYKPNESVDTSYIYDLVDDLEEAGYEVICVILDYLNRIRSVNKFTASEERLRLGAVTNELKTIATELHIPVLTAAQFNRSANKNIDEARESGTDDLVDLLGRDNIAESMKILDNLDAAFMIVPEFDANHRKYLGIKLAKNRYQADLESPLINTKKRCIHHPYTNNFSMRLMEDVGSSEPVHKKTLVEMQMRDDEGIMVDDEAVIPDNSNRFNSAVTETTKKNLLKEAGIENKSKTTVIGGTVMPNLDKMTEDEKNKYKKNKSSKSKSATKCTLTPDRYSFLYTLMLDPLGSINQRFVDDFNKEFKTNYGLDMYPYIASTREINRLSKIEGSQYEDMKCKKGVLYAPLFRIIEQRNLFEVMTPQEYEASRSRGGLVVGVNK